MPAAGGYKPKGKVHVYIPASTPQNVLDFLDELHANGQLSRKIFSLITEHVENIDRASSITSAAMEVLGEDSKGSLWEQGQSESTVTPVENASTSTSDNREKNISGLRSNMVQTLIEQQQRLAAKNRRLR